MSNRFFCTGASALALASAALLAAQPTHAQTRIDASAMYLLPGSFLPGGTARTQFIFYSFDPVELSTFSFSVRWDSDQVALQDTGPGSIAAWADTLQPYGPLTWQQVSATEIAGRWTGTVQAWPLSPDHRVQPLLHFQTTAAQTTPFTITFELPDLRYADGAPVDTGSGFYNSITLSPVPEPHAAWLLLAGGCALGWRHRRTSGAGAAHAHR